MKLAILLLPVLALLLCGGGEGKRLREGEKQRLLDAHNWFRGSLPGIDGEGRNLPRIADMNLLEWDVNLEAIAQDWADRCTTNYGYRECRSYPEWERKIFQEFQLPNLGQIILVYKKDVNGSDIDVSSAVNKTYSFLSYYIHSNRSCTTNPAACDTFTQLVWGETRKLGCALGKTCNYLVCNYYPQGNNVEFIEPRGWQKKSFGKPGEPCTKCSSGKGWCWNNLCVSNLTSDEGKDSTCAINDCEDGGHLNNCSCICPQHRLGNRCEDPCIDDIPCSDVGFAACSNSHILQNCPILCRRCVKKPVSGDEWIFPTAGDQE